MRDDASVDVAAAFVECPPGGRAFTRSRPVRLGDVTVSGRLRLDALARYLQDVAADDGEEFGVGGAGAWVLRRASVRVAGLPRFRDVARLTTFCSGAGPRWAERRTTVRVADRIAAESEALWVYVDRTGRPQPLEPWFHEHYGPSTAGRRVSGRLRLPGPPADAVREPWPLRSVDLDVLGHVNNAVAWSAVEELLARDGLAERVREATVEYRASIDPGDAPELLSVRTPEVLSCWLVCAEEVRVAARVDHSAGSGR